MKLRKNNRIFPCIFLGLLIALLITGCGANAEKKASSETEGERQAQTETNADAREESGGQEAGTVLGEGDREFPFTVVDGDGRETRFEIHTDKETVGEALEELGLIAGDEGEYGLYVKTVNGITADYDADGVYWAFYVNGEYAATGVDATQITEGDSYAFQIEKG